MRRLILFDIDGTLVWGGPAKDAFCQAMEETYGTMGHLDRVSFGGRTDPEIARSLLATVGVADDVVDAGLQELWGRYLAYLGEMIGGDPPTVLPGVWALLDALEEMGDVGFGLLTGNIEGGAQIKLTPSGLWSRFEFGSYGSDHEERDELPRIAVDRAEALWGAAPAQDEAIIVGDTPRDVSCARAGGMKVLAVATGMYSAEQLEQTGADHVLTDLTDTGRVVELLTE